MRSTLAWGLLVAGLFGSPRAAVAQQPGESDARMHFRVGRAYYDSGRFLEAAHEFEEAYRLSDRPALLYNIFVAYRDAGRVGPAVDALRRYLQLEQNIENRDQLQARLAAMERVLERQQASGETEATETTQTPTTQTATTETATTDASATEPAATETGPRTSADTAGAPPPSGGGGGGTWVPGWIIAGVGAAAMVGGVITGVLALDQQAALEAEYDCTPEGLCDPGFEGARDSGAVLAGLTDGLLFGGLAVAAVGVILALVLADEGTGERAALDVVCGDGGCVGAVRGSF